ncbi:thiamine pyrophosphate-binding protein [Nonomuraea sp. NPDC023979]|uniref:thiamine pyrophosphate-binding protein n=1 Tax=Nonomuraea sp. NPDC023979 TaxID=3154796 RepID=UPI0033F55211
MTTAGEHAHTAAPDSSASAAPARVADVIGSTLAALGVRTAFGLTATGNFHLVNALSAGGVAFVAARHPAGAATMADSYARASGRLTVLSVPGGAGVLHALPGIAEAASGRSPLLILSDVANSDPPPARHQPAVLSAAGVWIERITDPAQTIEVVLRAAHIARTRHRPVLLEVPPHLALSPHPAPVPERADTLDALAALEPPAPPTADATAVASLTDLLTHARRPVFLAGRGALQAGPELQRLAARTGALLVTSTAAHGLFAGDPFLLGLAGGLATPAMAELIASADVLIGWGSALGAWTLHHGLSVGADTVLAQIDVDPAALGAHCTIDLGVAGDAAATAGTLLQALPKAKMGYRTAQVRQRIHDHSNWHDVPYQPIEQEGRIDPRTLSLMLDAMLPQERILTVGCGNYMGYPIGYLAAPDARGRLSLLCPHTPGSGLAAGIGAALAGTDRLAVAALGDGSALMAASELETAVRLRLPLLIVVYNDAAHGAPLHHFGAAGDRLDTVTFPPADIAAIAAGYGCRAATVRKPADLNVVTDWLSGPLQHPLLIDAKVASFPSWWLPASQDGPAAPSRGVASSPEELR